MSTDSLAVLATGLAAFALVVAVGLAAQVGRLRRAYDTLVEGGSATTFPEALARSTAGAHVLRREVRALREEVATARLALASTLRHVAVVRHHDHDGRSSFSVALLDDAGDGLVLTSRHGDVVARSVQDGRSAQELSTEERQAVAHARQVRA